MQKKPKVIVIVGPTAVGKTALSLEIAQHFGTEIISADSLQVYRSLDIGTAKVSQAEQARVPHHLIDVIDWEENYTVADFQKRAQAEIRRLHEAGKVPVIVGGTGLYIQALLANYQLGGTVESAQAAEPYRAKWTAFHQQNGKQLLWEALKEWDPLAAEKIHPNNVKRVIRALEVKERTGKSLYDEANQQSNEWIYDVFLIGLTTDRAQLYERINERVEQMMTQGLEKEAQKVYQQPTVQAAQGIGYKEFFPYFEGKQDLATTIAAIQQHSRQYAKRQYTWFRNRMAVTWWDLVNEPAKQQKIVEELESWVND